MKDFRARWAGPSPAKFVRYPPELLAPFPITAPDVEWLAGCGLPDWAAPNMHFFCEATDRLPLPADPYGVPLVGAGPHLGMIGTTGEGWPICLTSAVSSGVICIELESPYRQRLLNSTIQQLAATLLAYNEAVEAALEYGIALGERDAWRRHRYPKEFDARLKGQIGLIDQPAISPEAYWGWHFADPDWRHLTSA